MLGHDDVAEYLESIAVSGAFEGVEEDVFCGGGVEVGFAVVATEGDEVVVAFLLMALEPERHGVNCRVSGSRFRTNAHISQSRYGAPRFSGTEM